METCDTTTDQVWKVWNWCSDSYLRHGIRLAFPKHTKPEKTYQWRYCRALVAKFGEWDFDDDTAVRFIDIAVKHAKNIGMLRKGLAIFHQSNMLHVVHDMLHAESMLYVQSLDTIGATHKWLRQQIGDGQPCEMLLRRSKAGALCNLAIWYHANKIPALYIALSKSCYRALATLEKQGMDERDQLPKATDLYRLRSDFVQDINNLKQARCILGDDWRELCH